MARTRRASLAWCPVLLVAAVAALLSIGAPGSAAPEPQATAEQVYTALGIDRLPADYVVMVDISSSMQQAGRYAAVKESLRAFFAALAPEDQVALGTFAASASLLRRGPAGRSPDTLLGSLPPTADGTSTDIGAAIEATITHLQRSDAPDVATVVLLTDGRHEPPRGSPYPFEQGYAWDQLKQRAAALKKRSLNAFAVPLSGVTGAALLAKVFPGTSVVDPTSIDRLTSQLERPKAAARAAKARSVLGDDHTRSVQVEWPDGVDDVGTREELSVTLRSRTSHIPLVVSELAVRTDDAAVRAAVLGGPVQLKPGGSATVRVAVDWDAGPRRLAPLSTVTRKADLELTASVGSTWSQVVTQHLGLPFDPQLEDARRTAGLSAQRGSLIFWVTGGVLLAAAFFALAAARRRRLQPDLSGVLVAAAPRGDGHELRLAGRTAVLNAGTIGLSGYGEVSASRSSIGDADIVLRISYSPDGTPEHRATGTCGPGESVVVGGVTFMWRAALPAPRRPARSGPGAQVAG